MDEIKNNEEQDSFLPRMDQEYLKMKGFKYSEIRSGDVCCLIIDEYPLPKDKFQVDFVSLLVRIPKGYNDTHPDMFFCHPHLKLISTGHEPPATSGRFRFLDKDWQQWSRHSNVGNDWRPGIDGISSHLQKVNQALKRG